MSTLSPLERVTPMPETKVPSDPTLHQFMEWLAAHDGSIEFFNEMNGNLTVYVKVDTGRAYHTFKDFSQFDLRGLSTIWKELVSIMNSKGDAQ